LKHVHSLVKPSLDPLQFAYQPRIGVEDAIIFLLHRAYTHLEEAGSFVRVMLFDFSSAFNTIRPALLRTKLLAMPGDDPLVARITNSLTGRPQYARLQSDIVRAMRQHLSGQSCLPPCSHSDTAHSPATCRSFRTTLPLSAVSARKRSPSTGGWWTVLWSGLNHLQLNITKTKKLVVVVDFSQYRGD